MKKDFKYASVEKTNNILKFIKIIISNLIAFHIMVKCPSAKKKPNWFSGVRKQNLVHLIHGIIF